MCKLYVDEQWLPFDEQSLRKCHRVRRACLRPSFTPAMLTVASEPEAAALPKEVLFRQRCPSNENPVRAKDVYVCHSCAVDPLCNVCVQHCHFLHDVEYVGIRQSVCVCRKEGKCAREEGDAALLPPLVLQTCVDQTDDDRADLSAESDANVADPKQAAKEARILFWLRVSLVLMILVWGSFVIILVPFFLYTLAYPWVVLVGGFHPLNGLHWLCLTCMAAILPFIALLASRRLPVYFKFVRDMNFGRFGKIHFINGRPTLPRLMEVTSACYTCSVDEIVHHFTGHTGLYGAEVIRVISAFLVLADVPLTSKDKVIIKLFPDRLYSITPPPAPGAYDRCNDDEVVRDSDGYTVICVRTNVPNRITGTLSTSTPAHVPSNPPNPLSETCRQK